MGSSGSFGYSPSILVLSVSGGSASNLAQSTSQAVSFPGSSSSLWDGTTLTVQEDGLYLVIASGIFSLPSESVNSVGDVRLLFDNRIVCREVETVKHTSQTRSGSFVFSRNAGDFLSLAAWASFQGSATYSIASASLSVFKVR